MMMTTMNENSTMVWKQEWRATRKGGRPCIARTRFSIIVQSTSSSWIITSFLRILIAYSSSVPFRSASITCPVIITHHQPCCSRKFLRVGTQTQHYRLGDGYGKASEVNLIILKIVFAQCCSASTVLRVPEETNSKHDFISSAYCSQN